LRDYFGDYRAVEIGGDTVTAYVTFRQDQKAAASTINNELAALSRMFTLGIRAGRVAVKPYIGKLALNNTRKGFFEWEQFPPVLENIPLDLQAPIETAYITGWRIHDEIFTRQKHHVDLRGRGWLRLDPGETKNNEGRNFPMTKRLREMSMLCLLCRPASRHHTLHDSARGLMRVRHGRYRNSGAARGFVSACGSVVAFVPPKVENTRSATLSVFGRPHGPCFRVSND
jgi:integrase